MLNVGRFVTLMAVLAAGCGGPSAGPSPAGGFNCSTPNDGILSLAWTVRGQPPSATSCQGVAQLEVTVAPDRCDGVVTIAPVDCTFDHWRYDHLAEGSSTVQVVGYDASHRRVLEGTTRVDLGPSVPDQPQMLDLD
jgi:hypothetical protein